MTTTIATFLLTCLATAFVCTAIKEDEDARLGMATARLFVLMGGGIALFAGIVQAVTLWAG